MENISNAVISAEYANAYVEIIEVLKRMSKTDYQKIPSDLIQKFENLKSKNYSFKYDDYKPLHEQKLMIKTKEILAMLFVDYFATDEEKVIISEKQKEFKIRNEQRLNEKYDRNEIFKNRKKEFEAEISNSMMTIYKKPLYLKIIDKLKQIFHITD